MKNSSKYPKSKGWITALLTLKKGLKFSAKAARGFISLGKPHTIQFGLIDLSRNPVRVIYRETKQAALDPDTQPIDSPMDMAAPVPFIAQCGGLIVQVDEVLQEFAPMPIIRCEILQGKHFNDAGNYGPGDTVVIGPLTEHWRILTFPDLTDD